MNLSGWYQKYPQDGSKTIILHILTTFDLPPPSSNMSSHTFSEKEHWSTKYHSYVCYKTDMLLEKKKFLPIL